MFGSTDIPVEPLIETSVTSFIISCNEYRDGHRMCGKAAVRVFGEHDISIDYSSSLIRRIRLSYHSS